MPLAPAEDIDRVEVLASPDGAMVPIEVDIVVAMRVDRCLARPETCDGGERILLQGCFDELDNDGDGFIDADDGDCQGVQGYTLVIATDPSFHLRAGESGATFEGTVSDDETRPPGKAHPPTLRYVDVIDPLLNGGQEGVLAACVLSLMTFVVLPPVEDSHVLRIRGDLDTSGLEPGDTSAPCRIDVRGPGEAGLRSRGVPVTTQVTVLGQNADLSARDLEVFVRIDDTPRFKRGDANSDGSLDISDVLAILGYLFLGSEAPGCIDSADTDDSGGLEITDGVAILEFLFSGNAAPPDPGPFQCGVDPTEDELDCSRYSGC